MDVREALDVVEGDRVCLVDGNNLGHRAFYGYSKNEELAAPLIEGFARMVSKALDFYDYATEVDPFRVVVAFDDAGVSLRRNVMSSYKDHADSSEESKAVRQQVSKQLDDMVDLLDAVGVRVLTYRGVEADDCIGWAAQRLDALGHEVLVISSDRDLMQLVSGNVTLLRFGQGSDYQLLTPREVRDRFGVSPSDYVSFAALRGDKSDGLEGVSGFGEKRAAALVNLGLDLGSVSLDDLGGVMSPKLAAKFVDGRGVWVRNVELMQLPFAAAVEGMDRSLACWDYAGDDDVDALVSELGISPNALSILRGLS